ncbi:MAG: transcriptional repressor [Treponema sp.]|jgi:Fur family ferric uptake transcriptional regulator|nr:transcriptional repressor [Treponema sp.]
MASQDRAGKRAAVSGYNTRQGKLIMDYLASLGDAHVTVNDIADHFRHEIRETIGLATIYRHLEKLVKAGTLCKYNPGEGESACYQYIGANRTEGDRFHLKCERCGKLIHLQCGFLDEILGHLRDEHRFRINPLKTVFYGSCEDCKGSRAFLGQ